MPNFIVAQAPQWLTTADAARALRMTDEGVRWLVRQGQLVAERTRSGQYLFRADDVVQLAQQRAAATLATVRPRMLQVRSGPRQLALFGAQLFRPPRRTWRSSSARARAR
jgi:excisionase family DNA binding protein